MVMVPHFSELAAKQIQEMVMGNAHFTPYLPNLEHLSRPLNRQYLYNVSTLRWSPRPLQIVNTLDSKFFIDNIREGYRLRQERRADKGNEAVEVAPNILRIIQGSHQVVHNRGKALAYLTGKRKERPHGMPRPEPHKYRRITGVLGGPGRRQL